MHEDRSLMALCDDLIDRGPSASWKWWKPRMSTASAGLPGATSSSESYRSRRISPFSILCNAPAAASPSMPCT